MGLIVKDGVLESATGSGTGDLTLGGAVGDYQGFSAAGYANGNTFPAYIAGASGTGEWQTAVLTYKTGGTVSRTAPLDGSSGPGVAVNFTAGAKQIGVVLPAELVGWNQVASIATISGSSVSFTSIPAYYSDLLMVFEGVSHNNGSNTTLGIELSDNNGTNWSTGTGTLTPSAAATATFYGQVSIPGYRLPAGSVVSSVADLAADRTLVGGGLTRVYRLAAGINAIRIAVSAGTLDAGTITLLGRL